METTSGNNDKKANHLMRVAGFFRSFYWKDYIVRVVLT